MHSLFLNNAKIIVGDGKLTKFWIDAWLGNQSLVVVYPPIFNLVRNQDETIHEVLARKLGSHSLVFNLGEDYLTGKKIWLMMFYLFWIVQTA